MCSGLFRWVISSLELLTKLQEMERIFTYSNSFSFSPRGHRLLVPLTAAQHFLIQLTSPSTIYHSYSDNTNPLSVVFNRALANCHWQSVAARALHPQIHHQIRDTFNAVGFNSLLYFFSTNRDFETLQDPKYQLQYWIPAHVRSCRSHDLRNWESFCVI